MNVFHQTMRWMAAGSVAAGLLVIGCQSPAPPASPPPAPPIASPPTASPPPAPALGEADLRAIAERFVGSRRIPFDASNAAVRVVDGGAASPVRAKVWFTNEQTSRALIVDVGQDGSVMGYQVVGIVPSVDPADGPPNPPAPPRR